MHYTLKDLARHAGLNERTVLRYLQRTGRLPVDYTHGTGKDGRRWRFAEADLQALLQEKARIAEERTRTLPAGYTQSADTMQAEILARLQAIEEQLATLRKHASWLFAPVGRQNTNLTEQPYTRPRGAVTRGEHTPASARTAGRASGTSGAPETFPTSANGRGRWVEAHGGPGASWVRSWADVLTWQGPEDAIAAVRRHKNWHDWQPLPAPSGDSDDVAGDAIDELEVRSGGEE